MDGRTDRRTEGRNCDRLQLYIRINSLYKTYLLIFVTSDIDNFTEAIVPVKLEERRHGVQRLARHGIILERPEFFIEIAGDGGVEGGDLREEIIKRWRRRNDRREVPR
jgi:hypothetical protein